MNYTIIILAFLLVLITFSRYVMYLKRELKELNESNQSVLKKNCELKQKINFQAVRNCELIDKLNSVENATDKEMDILETLGYREEDVRVLETENKELKARCQKMLDWIVKPQLEAASKHNRPIQVPGFYPDLLMPTAAYKFFVDQPPTDPFPDPQYDYEVTEPDELALDIEAHEGMEYNPYTKQYDIDPNWNWGRREAAQYSSTHTEDGYLLPMVTSDYDDTPYDEYMSEL